jgi:hypothetical protein
MRGRALIEMPAICRDCGHVFGSGFRADASTHIVFSGTIVTCPKCKGVADIPDGVYNFLNDTTMSSRHRAIPRSGSAASRKRSLGRRRIARPRTRSWTFWRLRRPNSGSS